MALYLLTAVFIAVGVFLRFYQIDNALFWHDELLTAARLSAHVDYSLEKFFQLNPVQLPAGIAEFRAVLEPSADKSIYDIAVSGISRPFYYMCLRIWSDVFGSSVWALRSFSAVLSVLLLPALYLLGRELFGQDKRFSCVLLILVSVSPFQIFYAREARMYSLLMLEMLLASILYLRLVRRCTLTSWLCYLLLIVCSLYTHLIFSLLLAAHILHCLIATQKPRTLIIALTTAYGLALIAAIPLFQIVFKDSLVPSHFTSKSLAFELVINAFIAAFGGFFVEVPEGSGTWFGKLWSPHEMCLADMLACVLIFASLLHVATRIERKSAIFVLLLALVTPAVFLGMDFVSGTQRSAIPRYFVLSCLGLEISAAAFLTGKAENIMEHAKPLIAAVLISVGIFSGLKVNQSFSFRKNGLGVDSQQAMVREINRAKAPVLLFSVSEEVVLNMSVKLKDQTIVDNVFTIIGKNKLAERYAEVIRSGEKTLFLISDSLQDLAPMERFTSARFVPIVSGEELRLSEIELLSKIESLSKVKEK